MKHLGIVVFLGLAVFVGACTENVRSRAFGGESSVDLPCGQKLFDVTWKESNLWYVTRPMRNDEQPETYKFSESSNFGVLEGTVTFNESLCTPTG